MRAASPSFDAARLVPPGALQVDGGAGDPRADDGAPGGEEQPPLSRGLRGILRGFGLKVGRAGPAAFEARKSAAASPTIRALK
jgi:hypothetical protein